MQVLTDNKEASMAIMNAMFLHGQQLTDDQRARLMEFAASPSPVDQYVFTAEYLYAERERIPNEWRDLGGALARFCNNNGWHLLGVDSRGQTVANIMARLMGEKPPTGVKWPAADQDPPVAQQFRDTPPPAAI